MSDSASAKIAVVIGIGAVALAVAGIRSHYGKPTPVSRLQQVETGVRVPPTSDTNPYGDPNGADWQTVKPKLPTQADRVALLEACSEGDQARVEKLFGKGVNLDGTLGDAAKSGNAALVGWLINHGVSAKEDEDLSVPPLLMGDEHEAVTSLLLARGVHEPTLAKAVAAGAPKATARLLAKGASPTSKSTDGEPVLMLAVRDSSGVKRRLIVDALIKAGADPSTKFEDETPLSLAVASAHLDESEKAGDRAIDLVAKLVAKGAHVDGDTLVAALGADADRRGALVDALLAGTMEKTATLRGVQFAVDNDDPASLKRLAAKGINWSALETHGASPLAGAIVASNAPMVKALLDAGAPMDRMGDDGDTALLAAVAAAAGESEDALRVVRVLLEHGANPNKRGVDGRTALYAAAQQGSEDLVALLVSKGARVDDAVDGRTPLEIADARGNDGVVKLLRARGAKRRKAAAVD